MAGDCAHLRCWLALAADLHARRAAPPDYKSGGSEGFDRFWRMVVDKLRGVWYDS
jgi:hypothetical protein